MQSMLSIVKQEFSLEDYVQLSKSKATLCLQTEKQEEKTQTQTLTVSPLLLAKCSPFFDVLALSLKNEDTSSRRGTDCRASGSSHSSMLL